MSREDEVMNEDELKQLMDSDPAFEAQLAKAMDVDVPELDMPELPEIDTENVVAIRPRVSRLTMFAVAATVVLGAFVGLRVFDTGGHYHEGTLAEQVVAHLDVEPNALVVTDVAVSDERLLKVVPGNVATMNHDAGLITYAMSCRINGRDVPHLVMQGKTGPVTILLMPEESVEAATPLEGENIHGIILPVGDGSIAIIGNKGEALEAFQQNVTNSVNWST